MSVRPHPALLRKARQRERILLAARELFTERGPDGVTVAEVAEAAGVSRATVFNHFGSKHALLEGITEDVIHAYDAFLQNALATEHLPVPTLLYTLFERMGAGIEAQRRFHSAVFREIAKLTLGLDEGGAAHVARQEALGHLIRLIERGQQRGELTSAQQSDDLAMAFDSLVFGTITHWLYDDESESLRDRMLRAAEIFLGPVTEGAVRPEEPLPALDQPVPVTPYARSTSAGDVATTARGARGE